MQLTTIVVLVSAIVLAQAGPVRSRRDDRVEVYCTKHREHYNKFCSNKAVELDRSMFTKLAKFCPAFEKHCTDDENEDSELVVPPPLPKGTDFALLDLPISEEERRRHPSSSGLSSASSGRLTAAIIASCTPDCTATHCTEECKCAHTHPQVHQMCNPPSSSHMAATCQQWYTKCPMFQAVQYY